ncbi:MAG: GH92 family glycosyl hydrolase [Bacteroidota bacterium]
MKAIKNLLLSFVILIRLGAQNSLASYVDPFIGTGGHGHTFPGATVPFGMVQLSPDARVDGSWDGCGGYHFSDSLLFGFSHTHLSGTGCSDYGDIALLPLDGKALKQGSKPSSKVLPDLNKFQVEFSHANEKASAGYYAVKLDNQINCELTATARVGFHRYTFANDYGRLMIKINHRDKTLSSDLKVINNRVIEGYRRSEAWAKDQYIFFRMEFSESFVTENTIGTKIKNSSGEQNIIVPYSILSFPKLNEKKLLVKVSISFVSTDGAKKNMDAELSHWDFERVKSEAVISWEKELSKVVVEGDEEKKKIFYTALYHCMVQPNISNDVDGSYRGRDNLIHQTNGHNYYTVFSLWDTFRGEHPLLSILDRKRTSDFVKTFLLQYQQGGRLPVWELASNETDCMIGYHSVSVINDAISKGIRDFDLNLAFDAMKKSATWQHLGLPALMKKNFIEAEDDHESVSKTLEYAYDDWCIAQTAKLVGRMDDYQYFVRRSQSWKNLFDPNTLHMRPRRNGGWHTPFDPKEVNNYFTEGNSWQYTFFVPHDISGLIYNMGGEESFTKKLNQLFSESSKTTGRDQADITGLIGQYAHGNEPSHHMAYLYNYVGKASQTQELSKRILNEMYKAGPDGLCGNEDCGQMSAWYVLSSIGIYQVCPGSGFYDITLPLFKKTTLNLENGKKFEVEISNPELLKKNDARISSLSINGMNLNWTQLSYEKIQQGGKLMIELTTNPNNFLEKNILEKRPDLVKDYPELTTVPIISADAKSFKDSLKVEITSLEKDKFIIYKIFDIPEGKTNLKQPLELELADNSPQFIFKNYEAPLTISKSQFVIAMIKESGSSLLQTITPYTNYSLGYFHKIPNNWKIEIKSKYNPQYTAGGDEGIIDGLYADENWRKGGWQGYQSQDFEAVIDLKSNREVKEVGANFLQDTRSWILMPKKVEISYETAKGFSKPIVLLNDVKDDDYSVKMKKFFAVLPSGVSTQRIKIKAYNYGKLPKWHQGFGGDAFIFVDELEVK